MRFSEFNSPTLLNEKLMDYGEWRKDKYSTPFTDAIIDGEDPVISINVDGEDVQGIVASSPANVEAARLLTDILSKGGNAKELATVKFEVNLLDDNDEPTEETTVVGIQQIVKDDKITGTLRVNLGNIAELVLGCAVTAKYEKEKGDVTVDDVLSVAVRFAQSNGNFKGNAGKDSLVFQASVPRSDKKAFYAYVGEDPKGKTLQDYSVKPEVIKGINKHIESAVTYVNTSPRVLLAVEKAAGDPNENEVEVISDGGNAEQQKVTKVDLKIMINPGPDGQPQRLNLLSIKAGDVGQFGQVSGYEFERLNSFFEQSLGMTISPRTQKKFATFAQGLKGKERKADRLKVRETNYYSGFTAAYDEIEKNLRALAKGDQLDLLERVYSGLLYHATRNEEGVEMVILSPNAKKAFAELTFGPELREALDDYNLVINRGSSEKMHIIQVHGVPKTQEVKKFAGTAKELLVQYRSYSQEAGVRNVIEMGNLLKDLADWEKIEQRKQSKQPAVQTKAQPIEPKVKAVQQPAPEPIEPTQPGVPSGTTTIAPAQSIQTTPTYDQEPDELGRIKRNAGITVE